MYNLTAYDEKNTKFTIISYDWRKGIIHDSKCSKDTKKHIDVIMNSYLIDNSIDLQIMSIVYNPRIKIYDLNKKSKFQRTDMLNLVLKNPEENIVSKSQFVDITIDITKYISVHDYQLDSINIHLIQSKDNIENIYRLLLDNKKQINLPKAEIERLIE